MSAVFAKHLDKELAGAVGNGGLVGEAGVGTDEDAEPDDALHAVEVTIHCRSEDSQAVEGALVGGSAGFIDGDHRWHRSGTHQLAASHGDLAADKDEVAGPDEGDVGGDGLGGAWQDDAKLFESSADDAHDRGSGRGLSWVGMLTGSQGTEFEGWAGCAGGKGVERAMWKDFFEEMQLDAGRLRSMVVERSDFADH